MICSQCGGQVIWRGPMHKLEFTQCVQCGAVNAQLPPDEEEEE